jgi:hypothetical protein
MAVIPAGFGQANLRFQGDALPTGAEITFGFDHDGSASLSDCATAFANAWTVSDIPALQTNGVELVEVLIKLGPNATGPAGVFGFSIPGESVSATYPPNTAMLIRRVTAIGGRSGRGRIYMPGVPEPQADGAGVLDTTYLSDAETAWDNFRGTISLAGLPLVLLHGETSPLSVPTAITDLAVAASLATQRRRLRR